MFAFLFGYEWTHCAFTALVFILFSFYDFVFGRRWNQASDCCICFGLERIVLPIIDRACPFYWTGGLSLGGVGVLFLFCGPISGLCFGCMLASCIAYECVLDSRAEYP